MDFEEIHVPSNLEFKWKEYEKERVLTSLCGSIHILSRLRRSKIRINPDFEINDLDLKTVTTVI